MAQRDNTDELPPVPTEPLAAPTGGWRRDLAAREPTEVITAADDDGRVDPRDDAATGRVPDATPDPKPARFAGARRRALLWDAGYCVVSGIVLLVLWASDRPVQGLPDWSSLVTGVAVVVWAGILAAVASGGVGRTATALVGLVNLLAGGIAFALGWFNTDIPTLGLVVAAQVVAFGVVQVMASVRR